MNDTFTGGDLWFLNHQARQFFRATHLRETLLYSEFYVKSICELFQLVPTEMQDQLKWNGPLESDRN